MPQMEARTFNTYGQRLLLAGFFAIACLAAHCAAAFPTDTALLAVRPLGSCTGSCNLVTITAASVNLGDSESLSP